MTLASAYVLHCLSAMWSQLQMMGRKSTMEQRWGLEGEVRKEENRDDMGGLRMAPEKVRRRGLHRPPPVSILVLFYSLIEFFVFCELNV